MLYAKGLVIMVGSIVSADAINRWAQALLANSILIETALSAESILKVVRK